MKYFDKETGKYRITKAEPRLEPENFNAGTIDHDRDDDGGSGGWICSAHSNVTKPETHRNWFETSSGRFNVKETNGKKKGTFHTTAEFFLSQKE